MLAGREPFVALAGATGDLADSGGVLFVQDRLQKTLFAVSGVPQAVAAALRARGGGR